MSTIAAETGRNLVRAAVGRDLLVAAARTLEGRGVPLLPLKGIYLQACVYAHPETRPIHDVDVLVPEHRFEAARARLVEAGWAWADVNASEATVTSPAHALPLDLHRRLFAPGAFHLPTSEVFARARPDVERFGVEVWLPDPRDVLAHLIGHFVKSRAGADDEVHLQDLGELGRAHSLAPADCARHLERTGLARAARYVLRYAVERSRDPFATGVLVELRRDPVGEALASLARFGGSRARRHPLLGALPGFLLDEPSLSRAAGALRRRAARAPPGARNSD